MGITSRTPSAPVTAILRTGAAALALAAALSCGGVASAAAVGDGPGPVKDSGTLILSDEDFARFWHASSQEQWLIVHDPQYRATWLDCVPGAGHVERNAWGPGWVCLPDGAVQ
ncbi:hypothetical protein [Streptomyces sp. VRA16 Mangrove soil]|uniref:hypothetical protein n=1 Tax=Streptomyces sp. VRA16 Mangrove soil TaxID=2817434 RepID=UPI001A9D7077|nr:hypothetical protein [Streptomyces sp. VRA16 Mangrove soil]MBO1335150.1 hypothetical protein [Streptomyces sp. VRA16 Mangrove soil]